MNGDEFSVSAFIAEKVVLSGIGKIKKINEIFIQVSMKDVEKKQSYVFTRISSPPRSILCLSVGPIALENESFFVADGKLSDGKLLTGYPVLKRLRVDTRTFLEQRRDALEGADCINV